MGKRIRPDWDQTFMLKALLAAARSSCNYLNTGAVIVQDKRSIADGYNGAPPTIENCIEKGCRKDRLGVKFERKGTGTCIGTHAERNAMAQIARKDLKGATLYSLIYPCSDCAKDIVANGIVEVVYSFIYKEPDSLTQELFGEAGVKLRSFKLDLEKYNKYNIMIKRILYQQNKK